MSRVFYKQTKRGEKTKKNKKAQTVLEGMGIVAVLVIIFISVIWVLQSSATTLSTSANESFTGVENTYVALDNDAWSACSAVRNATHNALTVTTGYVVNLDDGSVNITTAGGGNGTYYADYTYKAVGYVTSAMARTVIGFVTVLVAVGLMVFLGKGGKQ